MTRDGTQATSSVTTPLTFVVGQDATNRLLARLAKQRDELKAAASNGGKPPRLHVGAREFEQVRREWEQEVLAGEHRLYDLAHLLARNLMDTDRLQLVARIVAGPREEDEGDAPRIVIEERLDRDYLRSQTDYSLASAIAQRYQYRRKPDQEYGRLYPRASFLEIRPLESREDVLTARVLTRVKANDQIWNKVCDAFFAIDQIVERNKILNAMSEYVTDVFGIKVLVPRRRDCYTVEEMVGALRFDDAEIASLGLEPGDPDVGRRLTRLERKDYIDPRGAGKKATGWEAVKNVYRWRGQVFEIQFQTEANYFLELSDMSQSSHRTFKMKRRLLRMELDKQVPHYAEFRQLFRGVFDPNRNGDTRLPPWLQLG